METRNESSSPSDETTHDSFTPAFSIGDVLRHPDFELLLEELAAAIEAENGVVTP